MFRIPSEEVKHISAERREELAGSYGEHERETRLEGVPQLGAGPIFPVELLPAVVAPFNPDSLPAWCRWCVGIDFGFGHPFAAVMTPDRNFQNVATGVAIVDLCAIFEDGRCRLSH